MNARRPSALTITTCVLLVLLPTLAVLQYRWVGQVSDGERERRQRNLRTAAFQFREAFDGEVARAMLSLRTDAATVRDSAWYRYAERFEAWTDTATEPRIVSAVYLVDADDAGLRLRRWDTAAHVFEDAAWPSALATWRARFEDDLAAFLERRPIPRRPPPADAESVLVLPLPNVGPRPVQADGSRPGPVFGYTVVQLDMAFVRERWLPALVERHFVDADGDSYRVAVLSNGNPDEIIYRSDAEAPLDPRSADAAEPLHAAFAGPMVVVFRRDGDDRLDARRGDRGNGRLDDSRLDPREASRRDLFTGTLGPDGSPDQPRVQARFINRQDGRWTLLVQHESGSLETAVLAARRRNLGISFGILMLLTVSVALLAVTSRRAQRLARQQMEFVAGVSHELRTPVAVIRSAAENLSQGVVATGDRVRRYGEVIETEARRLGDMVERVLLYAGIESGLGMGAQVRLAPAALVDEAVAAAQSAVPDATIERTVATGLPSVLGDPVALRSALQNLIVNAAKYGGTDRWVGVRADLTGRGHEVRIVVEDHGRGIPPEDLPHIFDPFYRGRGAVTGQVHGNGLGLSLVKRIVTAHGGRVTVHTTPGAGSTFTLILPVAEPSTAVVDASGAHAAEGIAGS